MVESFNAGLSLMSFLILYYYYYFDLLLVNDLRPIGKINWNSHSVKLCSRVRLVALIKLNLISLISGDVF